MIKIISMTIAVFMMLTMGISSYSAEEIKVTPINPDFDLVETNVYELHSNFKEGLAMIFKDSKWGFINKKGKISIEPQFEKVSAFGSGVAEVWKNGKYGLIDINGKELENKNENDVFDFSTISYFWDFDKNKVGFKDKKTGAIIIEPKYDGVRDFEEGLYAVQKDDKWGFVDRNTGKIVIEPQYEDVGEKIIDGLGLVRKFGKYGYIDKTGKTLIETQFDDALSFSEGLAGVMKDGKCGFIDKQGKMTIELPTGFGLNSAYFSGKGGRFSEGMAWVEKEGKWGLINKSGEIIIEPQYKYADDFSEGLALVGNIITRGANFYGCDFQLINKTGKVVLQPQFDYVESFHGGLAIVAKRDSTIPNDYGIGYQRFMYGVIDKTGKVVIEPQFDSIGNFSEGVALVTKENKVGYLVDRRPIVEVNGKRLSLDVTPININGRLLVPFREIFEAFGILVEWDNQSRTIKATKGSNFKMELKIESKTAIVQGNEVSLDVPAQIINGRTIVPLRFIGESIGAKVEWDVENRIANLSVHNDGLGGIESLGAVVLKNDSSYENLPITVSDNLVVEEAVFGIRVPDKSNAGMKALPSNYVPGIKGQPYGWALKIKTTLEKVKLREELVLPAPGNWTTLGDTTVSEDKKIGNTTRVVPVGAGVISNTWCYAEGDPKGTHKIRIWIEDRLVAEFNFEVL